MSRRVSATTLPSRTRVTPDMHHKPRHTPRSQPHATMSYNLHTPAMIPPNYDLVSAAPTTYPSMAQYFPAEIASYYPPNEGSYIPTCTISPTDLGFSHFDLSEDSGYSSALSSSSSESSKSDSPPMTEAEMTQAFFAQEPYLIGSESYSCQDPWTTDIHCAPTPPPELELDLFNADKGVESLAFRSLPEPALQQCEYIGVSSLQFSKSVLLPF